MPAERHKRSQNAGVVYTLVDEVVPVDALMRISFRTESDATRGITAEQNIRDFRLMSASRLVFTSPSLTRRAFDRHRGSGCPLTPATPPCVRVRTRRFEMVTLTRILQIRETERFKIGRGKRDG